MYAQARLTSESSDETYASASTEQTDLSEDDVIVGSSKTPKTYKHQGNRYLGTVHNATTLDTEFECQRRLFHRIEESEHDGYFNEKEARLGAREDYLGRKGESIPLLYGSKREYLVQDIIRSEEFRKLFEAEYADIGKFRKNYKSLRTIFLTLAVLNIVLIICAVSVMPVILVSLRLEKSHETQSKDSTTSLDFSFEEFVLEKLSSKKAKKIIRQYIYCGDCGLVTSENFKTFRDFKNSYDKTCCGQDIFIPIKTFMDNILEKLETEKQTVHNSIDRLENAVISLQESNRTDNETIHGSFQKTMVHKRVEYNNKMLNTLLNWKRSSLQLTGTAKNGQIVWGKDVSNGDILSYSSKGIYVKSGGTYFLYTKIQFSKGICTGTEKFEYHVMRERGSTSSLVAKVKLGCAAHEGLEQPLAIQRVVHVPLTETATFYVKYNPIGPSFISNEFNSHVFGIIEI